MLNNATGHPPCTISPPTATIEASVVTLKDRSKSGNANTGADVNFYLSKSNTAYRSKPHTNSHAPGNKFNIGTAIFAKLVMK